MLVARWANTVSPWRRVCPPHLPRCAYGQCALDQQRVEREAIVQSTELARRRSLARAELQSSPSPARKQGRAAPARPSPGARAPALAADASASATIGPSSVRQPASQPGQPAIQQPSRQISTQIWIHTYYCTCRIYTDVVAVCNTSIYLSPDTAQCSCSGGSARYGE